MAQLGALGAQRTCAATPHPGLPRSRPGHGAVDNHPNRVTPVRPAEAEYRLMAIGRTKRLGCGAMPDDNADLSSPSGSASPGAETGGRRVVERLDEASCTELLSA